MTMEEYAAWAASIAKLAADPDQSRLSYLALGMSGEAGEVAGEIKKWLRDGRLDRAALIDELGDVAYYWACLCVATGQSPADVLAQSRRKIEAKLAAR